MAVSPENDFLSFQYIIWNVASAMGQYRKNRMNGRAFFAIY
jgi:hypothetical protein